MPREAPPCRPRDTRDRRLQTLVRRHRSRRATIFGKHLLNVRPQSVVARAVPGIRLQEDRKSPLDNSRGRLCLEPCSKLARNRLTELQALGEAFSKQQMETVVVVVLVTEEVQMVEVGAEVMEHKVNREDKEEMGGLEVLRSEEHTSELQSRM